MLEISSLSVPPGSISDPERGHHLRHTNPKRHMTSSGGIKIVHPIHPDTVRYHIPSEIREEGESPKKDPRSMKPIILMTSSAYAPPSSPPPPPPTFPPKRRGSPEGNEMDEEEEIEIQVIDECSKISPPLGDQCKESISVVWCNMTSWAIYR